MTGFVIERFSTGRMVADHEALYRRVVTERSQSDGRTRGEDTPLDAERGERAGLVRHDRVSVADSSRPRWLLGWRAKLARNEPAATSAASVRRIGDWRPPIGGPTRINQDRPARSARRADDGRAPRRSPRGG
jgi:hypothetical protein